MYCTYIHTYITAHALSKYLSAIYIYLCCSWPTLAFLSRSHWPVWRIYHLRPFSFSFCFVWKTPTTECDATIRCTLLHSQKKKKDLRLLILIASFSPAIYIWPSMQLWREDHYSKLLYKLVWSHLRFLTFLKDVSASQSVRDILKIVTTGPSLLWAKEQAPVLRCHKA